MSRLIDSKLLKEDNEELSLRPQYLSEYIGQEEIKGNLKIFIGAAKKRNETLDHCLFFGPPGLGKTTFAHVIANEMNGNIKVISGPTLEKSGDLVCILSELEPGDILFIDEIHRIPRVVEEVLYEAMEDYKISIIINKESQSKTITIDIPPFTLIGATTRAGDLSSPLRARFGIIEKINYYTEDELKKIVTRTSKVFNIQIDELAALEIAKRSRGTPRIANRLFRRVRDFADFNDVTFIDLELAKNALKSLKIDSIGLDDVDIKYLNTIITRYNGGPVGLEAIANAIGEESTNLEDVYEPYLIQIGFIDRTLKGRVVTSKCYEYFNILKHS